MARRIHHRRHYAHQHSLSIHLRSDLHDSIGVQVLVIRVFLALHILLAQDVRNLRVELCCRIDHILLHLVAVEVHRLKHSTLHGSSIHHHGVFLVVPAIRSDGHHRILTVRHTSARPHHFAVHPRLGQRLLRSHAHERNGVEALGVVGVVPRGGLLGLCNRKGVTRSRVVVCKRCEIGQCRQVERHVNLRAKCLVERCPREARTIRLQCIHVIQVSQNIRPGLCTPHSVLGGSLTVDRTNRASRVTGDAKQVVHWAPANRHRLAQSSATTRSHQHRHQVQRIPHARSHQVRVQKHRCPARVPRCRVNIFQRTNHVRLVEDLAYNSRWKRSGNLRQYRESLNVSDVTTVGGIYGTHQTKLRPMIATGFRLVRGAIHRQVRATKVGDHTHIGHAAQLLRNTVTSSPCTLERLQKLIQHAIRSPEEPQCLRLKYVHQVGARVIGAFELIDLLVQLQQHVLGQVAEDATELSEAKIT